MTNTDIKAKIARLREQLEAAGSPDPETVSLLQQLDADLHRLLDQSDPDSHPLRERVETLAADFDAQHPQAAAILREIAVALARVGI